MPDEGFLSKNTDLQFSYHSDTSRLIALLGFSVYFFGWRSFIKYLPYYCTANNHLIYRGGHKSLYPVQLLLFELGKVIYGHPCISMILIKLLDYLQEPLLRICML